MKQFEQICFMFHVTGLSICFWHIKNVEGNPYNCLKETNEEENKLVLKNNDWIIHRPSANSKQLVRPTFLQSCFWTPLSMISNIFFSFHLIYMKVCFTGKPLSYINLSGYSFYDENGIQKTYLFNFEVNGAENIQLQHLKSWKIEREEVNHSY